MQIKDQHGYVSFVTSAFVVIKTTRTWLYTNVHIANLALACFFFVLVPSGLMFSQSVFLEIFPYPADTHMRPRLCLSDCIKVSDLLAGSNDGERAACMCARLDCI